jgi:hypothetical protein
MPGLEEAPSSPAHKRDAYDDYFISTIFCVRTKSPACNR